MHGDSCFADRVDPDPMCSTSYGDDCTGPPAPLCPRENAMVDNSAAAPKSCLPSFEVRSPTAAGGLLPSAKPVQQQIPPSTSHLFGSTRPRRRIQGRNTYGLQFHPPGTTAASGTCLLPLPAEGLSRQNQCKIGCLIQAAFKVVSAPARFGDHGVPCCVEVHVRAV